MANRIEAALLATAAAFAAVALTPSAGAAQYAADLAGRWSGPRITRAPTAYQQAGEAPIQSWDRYPRHPVALAMGGLAGGAVGFISGALIGAVVASDDGYEAAGLGLVGGTLGAIVGIPVGTHLTNGRRGRLGPGLAASLVTMLAGAAAAAIVDDEGVETAILISIPVAMTIASVAAERTTTR